MTVMHNPDVLNHSQLLLADNHTIAVYAYEFMVASVSLFYALCILVVAFKICVWFFPKYYRLPKEADA